MLARDLEEAVVHGGIEHVVLQDFQVLSWRCYTLGRVLPSHMHRWLLVLFVYQGRVPWLLMSSHIIPAQQDSSEICPRIFMRKH